jgi:hypothetical protein
MVPGQRGEGVEQVAEGGIFVSHLLSVAFVGMLWARWSSLTERINSLSNAPAVGDLLLFAASAADSLAYLADVDERAFGENPDLSGVNPDAIDIAHVRWACTTALTAVDLGAGVLGRLHMTPLKGQREYAIASFQSAKLEALRATSNPAARWIEDVVADPEYADLLEARHALVHKWLTRTVSYPRQRVRLHLKSGEVDARTLVTDSRDFASLHIGQLFDAFEKKAL